METYISTVSFTPEQWNSMDLKKGDLVWISEEQGYVQDAIDKSLPHSIPATLNLIHKVYRSQTHVIIGACIYSIMDGNRGKYGIYKSDIVRNATQDYKEYFAARSIQRSFRTYLARKKQILKALQILQPIAREWYVNPNNPSHQQRMKAIAEKWGMRP